MAVLACGVGESERRDSLFAKTRLRVCVRATPRNKAGVVVFVCWRPAEALFHVPVVVRPQGRSEFHLPIAGGGAGRAREGADGFECANSPSTGYFDFVRPWRFTAWRLTFALFNAGYKIGKCVHVHILQPHQPLLGCGHGLSPTEIWRWTSASCRARWRTSPRRQASLSGGQSRCSLYWLA